MGSLLVFVVGFLSLLNPAGAETSLLWGENGEAWDSTGPLPDFSFAGYHQGEASIPTRSDEVDARDFGVTGDGITDDTAALREAIEASAGKVIVLPEGRFLLTGMLEITSSGTVLRGSGPRKSILVCPKPLEEIEPRPITNANPTTAYSWSGGIVRITAPRFGYRRLTTVLPGSSRGDSVIQVADTRPLRVGEEILLTVTDDPSHSLIHDLYAGDPGNLSRFRDRASFRQAFRIRKMEGNTITLDRSIRYDIRREWQPELRQFDSRVRECGLESLGFEFPAGEYGGHFSEVGYNAIELQNVVHCWVQDVCIVNADSGIYLDRAAFCTVRNIVLESKRKPDSRQNCTGHHGIQIIGEDNLVTDFNFRTRFIHDLTVQNAVGNVFSNGRGIDLSLDHHRHAPHENLFSNLDIGLGTRVFYSGGAQGSGRHSAARTTFWNLRTWEAQVWPKDFGPDRINWIGVKTSEDPSTDRTGRWIETITPGTLEPADLHASQIANRRRSNS